MTPSQRHVLDFNPRRLFTGGVPGAFWDISDRKTLFQDAAMTTPVAADGDPVGAIMDKSGNGNHLLQVGADATRVTYKTSGGLHWVEGDGTADYLRALFTIAEPWERISAIHQITYTASDRILGGGSANSGFLYQRTTSPDLAIFGTVPVSLSGEILAQNQVITERLDSIRSRAAVDNGPYVTGNPGATAPGGMTLFANSDTTAFANARFYGCIMRHGVMTDVQIGNARRYFATKAGVAL